MTEDWPKITARRDIAISPWMKVIERAVEFRQGQPPELYHAVGQQDYVAIVARTPDGLVPIVRQYRPAIERFAWELPAGLVEPGEEPAETCRRELLEETALAAVAVHPLGSFAACTARLSNRVHSFFAEADRDDAARTIEDGIELKLVAPSELAAMIHAGEFTLQLHIGALMLAGMRGFLDLAAFNGA